MWVHRITKLIITYTIFFLFFTCKYTRLNSGQGFVNRQVPSQFYFTPTTNSCTCACLFFYYVTYSLFDIIWSYNMLYIYEFTWKYVFCYRQCWILKFNVYICCKQLVTIIRDLLWILMYYILILTCFNSCLLYTSRCV